MTIEILIVGAGAVGAFYASRLAHAPEARISVICRSNFNAVSSHGFKVESPEYGNEDFHPYEVFSSPEAATRSAIKIWDYVVVSTKALPDVTDDSVLLEGLIDLRTSVVLIQNGLGVEAPYVKRFPQATILSAVTIVSAAQPQHGVIKHNRWTRISIGPYLLASERDVSDKKEATPRNTRFVALLQAGGIKDAEAYDHEKLQLVRWHKVAINAAMNPSSVLSGGSTNASMALDAEMHMHLKGVIEEVLITAIKIMGVPFPKEFASADTILKSTMKNKSGSKPSMQVDWEQGKRMELEVILGNPIKIAKNHGLEMPRLQSMYAMLKMAQANRTTKENENKL